MSHETMPSQEVADYPLPEHSTLAREQSDVRVDDTFERIVFEDIADRLYDADVPSALKMEKSEVFDVLAWADTELRGLERYASTLGIKVPASLEEYFAVQVTTPAEWRTEYETELHRRISVAEQEITDYFAHELQQLEAQVRQDAANEGCDDAQTEWRVSQAKIWKQSQIEEHVIRPRRAEIHQKMSEEYVPPKRLPALLNRFYQLADLRAKQETFAAEGKTMQLVPVPYKTIDETILPAFSAQDTVPRQWPNWGRDLGDFYLDPAYISTLRGEGMFKRHTTQGTYYEDTYRRDEAIGDFGLALVAVGDTHSGLDESLGLEEVRNHDYQEAKSPQLSKADFAIGIVWALETVARIRRGDTHVNKYNPVKMVLPGFIRSASDKNAVMVSVYLTNPDNPYDTRLGIAFDAYSETQAKYDTYPALQAATSW